MLIYLFISMLVVSRKKKTKIINYSVNSERMEVVIKKGMGVVKTLK